MRYGHHKIVTPWGFLILLFAVVLGGCGKSDKPNPSIQTEIEFRADGVLDFVRPDSTIVTRIAIEIAESTEAQATGLMYRRSLPERGGMLFVDPAPTMRSFWMKNTALALDILFVDQNGEIINIVHRTTPFSETQILSTAPAQFVVEVRAGFVDKYGITENDHIVWERRTF